MITQVIRKLLLALFFLQQGCALFTSYRDLVIAPPGYPPQQKIAITEDCANIAFGSATGGAGTGLVLLHESADTVVGAATFRTTIPKGSPDYHFHEVMKGCVESHGLRYRMP